MRRRTAHLVVSIYAFDCATMERLPADLAAALDRLALSGYTAVVLTDGRLTQVWHCLAGAWQPVLPSLGLPAHLAGVSAS
jgi:hypothetical protein